MRSEARRGYGPGRYRTREKRVAFNEQFFVAAGFTCACIGETPVPPVDCELAGVRRPIHWPILPARGKSPEKRPGLPQPEPPHGQRRTRALRVNPAGGSGSGGKTAPTLEKAPANLVVRGGRRTEAGAATGMEPPVTGTPGNLARLLRTTMRRPEAKPGGIKPVSNRGELYRLFLIFFLVVHEGHRLRHPLGPGWIIFIQFNFIIKIAKVMID